MGSMHIVCPHCTTSYAIGSATLGAAGRTVRCSRCKEVWLARPEDAVEAAAPVMAEAGAGEGSAAAWGAERGDHQQQDIPVVESPSISGDWPAAADASSTGSDWPSEAKDAAGAAEASSRPPSWFR